MIIYQNLIKVINYRTTIIIHIAMSCV